MEGKRVIRKLAYLTPAQEMGIKRMARSRGIPEAEVIRQAVSLYLRQNEEETEDPLLRTAGMAVATKDHNSTTFEEDLYGRSNLR